MYSQDINPDADEEPMFERSRPHVNRWYRRRWAKFVLVVFFIVLVVLGAFAIYVARISYLISSGQLDPQQFLNQPTVPGQKVTMATDDDPSLGPKAAKVVIVEFSDFQCPSCGQAYPVVKKIISDYGDRIRFVYRDFPLVDVHPQALQAALAADCALEQGKFWEMHDKLFENQENLTEADLKRYAVQLGLNSVQFGSCLGTNKYLTEVQDDYNAGITAGVEATPTFFINGSLVRGALPYEALQQIIVGELNR